MSVQITLREYLKTIKTEEAKKAVHHRRPVPTIREFIEASGTTESNYFKFLRNDPKDLNRGFIDASIHLLRARGFDVQICDIIRYESGGNND